MKTYWTVAGYLLQTRGSLEDSKPYVLPYAPGVLGHLGHVKYHHVVLLQHLFDYTLLFYSSSIVPCHVTIGDVSGQFPTCFPRAHPIRGGHCTPSESTEHEELAHHFS
jgi:hypothetical protein